MLQALWHKGTHRIVPARYNPATHDEWPVITALADHPRHAVGLQHKAPPAGGALVRDRLGEFVRQAVERTDYLAAEAYLAGLNSDVGRRGMACQVRKVARAMGAPDHTAVNWASLNAANVKAIIAQIGNTSTATGEPPAPASVALALAALKGIARAEVASLRMSDVDLDAG